MADQERKTSAKETEAKAKAKVKAARTNIMTLLQRGIRTQVQAEKPDLGVWRDINDIDSDDIISDEDKNNSTANITIGHLFSPSAVAARTPLDQCTPTKALCIYYVPKKTCPRK